MNKDQVKGRTDEVIGGAKKAAGEALDKPDLRDKGADQEAKGKLQKTYGDVKNKLGKAIDS